MERVAYKPDEAAKMIGIGRSRLYEEIKEGRLVAVKLGKRTLITETSLREWLASLPEVAADRQEEAGGQVR